MLRYVERRYRGTWAQLLHYVIYSNCSTFGLHLRLRHYVTSY